MHSSLSPNKAPRRAASRIVSISGGRSVVSEARKGPRIYQVQVAGKIFQGPNARALLKLAVAAKRSQNSRRGA